MSCLAAKLGKFGPVFIAGIHLWNGKVLVAGMAQSARSAVRYAV